MRFITEARGGLSLQSDGRGGIIRRSPLPVYERKSDGSFPSANGKDGKDGTDGTDGTPGMPGTPSTVPGTPGTPGTPGLGTGTTQAYVISAAATFPTSPRAVLYVTVNGSNISDTNAPYTVSPGDVLVFASASLDLDNLVTQ